MPVLEQSSDVLARFSRGDLGAFEELFRQHQGAVYRWILQVARDPGIAEDLTVETFWRIYRAHARFDPRRGFAAWVRRIAMNAALDFLKSAKREDELTEDMALPEAADAAIAEETRRKTAQAFRRLPPKLQMVATLALIEEQPHKEIAEALGISTGAVKVRLYRAIRRLRSDLKQQGIEP